MGKKAILVIAMFALAAGGFLALRQVGGVRPNAGLSPWENPASVFREPANNSSAGSDQVARWAKQHYVFDKRQSSESIKVGDVFLGVETQEQADWLNRNMFPTQEQRLAMSARDGNIVMPKDLVPKSVQDLLDAEHVAHLNAASRADAKAVLNHGAMMGSVYALHALASVSENQGEHTLAAAYRRAAYLRGDWMPGFSAIPSQNSPMQITATDALGYQIVVNANAWRAARGLPPLKPDVRPGLNETIKRLSEMKWQ
ncbi:MULTISPECIES: hypothetical protein [unclassified Lysobacter]|uniref:hypothetical protein n=1 Tax=unclassified Lysobacter TaxID=2635362 RepID=UPI000ABE231F|nr:MULTISPECIES: hypothetical protein [unclassified Lysobacter]